MTGIVGSARVTRWSDTAACAPKLDDNACGPGRLVSPQRTRVSASTDASQSLTWAASASSVANWRAETSMRGASAGNGGPLTDLVTEYTAAASLMRAAPLSVR